MWLFDIFNIKKIKAENESLKNKLQEIGFDEYEQVQQLIHERREQADISLQKISQKLEESNSMIAENNSILEKTLSENNKLKDGSKIPSFFNKILFLYNCTKNRIYISKSLYSLFLHFIKPIFLFFLHFLKSILFYSLYFLKPFSFFPSFFEVYSFLFPLFFKVFFLFLLFSKCIIKKLLINKQSIIL